MKALVRNESAHLAPNFAAQRYAKIAPPHCRRKLDDKGGARDLGPAIEKGYAMRKLIVLTAAAAALLVSACNTISGVGKDAQAAGRAVTGAAEDAKK